MERPQHQKAIDAWLSKFTDQDTAKFVTATRAELGRRQDVRNAVYALNEMHMWPDCEGMGPEAVLKAWALIERLLEEKFPDTLKM